MLSTPEIIRDYGELFPSETKRKDMKKSSISNFEAHNGVKVASKSLGGTIRGTTVFSKSTGKIERPTLLVLDDIDTDSSVKSMKIIESNENKIF